MKKVSLFVLLSCIALGLKAQWITTPSPLSGYRYDDVYFLNPNLGWAVNYSLGSDGAVLKTTDGGASWQTMLDSSGAKFRDIGFVDSLNGFIGTLQTGYNPQDTVIMYKTSDGGSTWSRVTNLPGPRPGGICGMYVINDSTLYACGRYYGPAGFYKTTDKGTSWTYNSLAGFAGGIVDMHFFDKDTGIAVGGSISNFLNAKGRILRTVDGGNTWTIVHTSAHTKEICWKVSFPSPNIGYVSLESFRGSGPQYFLKTTDGGLTWTDMQFLSGGTYDSQGIGFINDTTGWIGGDAYNFKTTNGGLSWTPDSFGTPVNRFRFFADTLGYAAGQYIYKFHSAPTGISSHDESKLISSFSIHPNPFSSVTEIHFSLEQANPVVIQIADITGRIIKQTSTRLTSGAQVFNWNGTNESGQEVASGMYFVKIETPGGVLSGKILKE